MAENSDGHLDEAMAVKDGWVKVTSFSLSDAVAEAGHNIRRIFSSQSSKTSRASPQSRLPHTLNFWRTPRRQRGWANPMVCPSVRPNGLVLWSFSGQERPSVTKNGARLGLVWRRRVPGFRMMKCFGVDLIRGPSISVYANTSFANKTGLLALSTPHYKNSNTFPHLHPPLNPLASPHHPSHHTQKIIPSSFSSGVISYLISYHKHSNIAPSL